MTTPRTYHTATLLQDGRVLIAGGAASGSANAAIASAELYDPATGTFTAVGNMTTARAGHTATLSRDGKVLIAGGFDPNGFLSSAELYDPSTGTFTATGNMLQAQGYQTATLLRNGKVLIAGGISGRTGGPIVANAELYDPSTGAFTATGGYSDSFNNLEGFASTSTLLPDGRVLFATEPTAELYDSVNGTFGLTGSMTTSFLTEKPNYIGGRTATLLINGKVMLAGGEHEDLGRFANAELYDPSTGIFTPTGSMTRPRDLHTATLLPNGTVLIAGGESQDCTAQGCIFSGTAASAEIYDPSTGTFAAAGNMTSSRELHTATLLNDGRVLNTGGEYFAGIGSFFCCLNSAELYVPPASDPWQQAITAMKASAGTDSANFWQWAWYWQRSSTFPGAPAEFGVLGSIDNIPGLIDKIVAAGGGDGFQNVPAQQWVLDYRQAVQPPDPWQQAITAMKAAVGTDNANFWQWAWYWQRTSTFPGAPSGFGVLVSIDNTPGLIDKIVAAGGGNGFQIVSAEQWVLYYRLAATQ